MERAKCPSSSSDDRDWSSLVKAHRGQSPHSQGNICRSLKHQHSPSVFLTLLSGSWAPLPASQVPYLLTSSAWCSLAHGTHVLPSCTPHSQVPLSVPAQNSCPPNTLAQTQGPPMLTIYSSLKFAREYTHPHTHTRIWEDIETQVSRSQHQAHWLWCVVPLQLLVQSLSLTSLVPASPSSCFLGHPQFLCQWLDVKDTYLLQ